MLHYGLDIEVLSGSVDSHVHVFVADVLKSFDTVDRVILDRSLGCLPGSAMLVLSTTRMCVSGSSLLLGWGAVDSEWWNSAGVALEHDVQCGLVLAVVQEFGSPGGCHAPVVC